jgi:hypothetical protein
MSNYTQWIRKVGLILFKGEKGLDLSEFRIRFQVTSADVETPNNAAIRVYNLSQETIQKIQGEFSEVVLNAGYQNGNYGVIFKGTIKQFKIGRENAIDSYLDILAGDGDIEYNQAFIELSLKSNTTPKQQVEEIAKAMGTPADLDSLIIDKQHTPSLRGAVLFGLARSNLRNITTSLDASWSIQNGTVVLIDNTGYRDGTVVEINVSTGLIGVPEQTGGGIRLKCLINSRIQIGCLVKLNNAEIVQLLQQNPDAAPVPYNQRTGIQPNASLSLKDSTYRVYAIDHEGDSRGQAWYSTLVCLAVDLSAPRIQAVGAN